MHITRTSCQSIAAAHITGTSPAEQTLQNDLRKGATLALALQIQAFAPGRTPRSDEYKRGVRAILLARTIGKPFASPYKAGTTAADAFFAGADEGRSIWAEYQRRLEQAA